eukprot:CCRYP_007418-RA/>CCRYP_007418-RA protein AED:0.39 eAED:0.39 QI:0/-1/0/1/-1/1/1/0/278
MKVSAVAYSLIVASSASAQKGNDPQRLRHRLLKAEKEQEKHSKEDGPAMANEPVPLSAVTSMSMSIPYALADPAFPEWDADLAQFAFDASVSLSMSMAPVKCDKKCQKEQAKAEAAAIAAEPEFSEWGAAALTEFEFDVSLSQSMSMPTVKCDKKCQKEKLGRRHRRMEGKAGKEPVESDSSLSLSVDFGAWAEPDLELFGFEAFEGSMSFSLPQAVPPATAEKCDKKCQKEQEERRTMSTDSSLSLSVNFEAWAEPDLVDFGFETFDASLSFSMSTP